MTTPKRQSEAAGGRSAAIALAALAIASGKQIKNAAADAGVSETTIYRWLRKPGFKRQVTRLRSRMIDEAVGTLSRFMNAAVDVLARLLASTNEATQFRAARAILEMGTKLQEQGELHERIAALEESKRKGN